MSQPSPVFISYGRADGEDVARRLYDDLARDNIVAWLDVKSIPQGADWDQAIDDGLGAAWAVLVLLTPAAVLSLQAKSEWYAALNRNLPVIPLLVRDCAVPRVLSVLNFVDLRTQYAEGVVRVEQRLHELDANYHQVLRDHIQAFEVAQSEATDPKRFQPKLDELRAALAWWEQKADDRTRIERGVLEQIAELERRREQRRQRVPSTVVGHPPRDVTTLFKDRTEHRARMGSLLTDPATRLISVIGRGGMGKTALATKILRDIEQGNWPQTDESPDVDGIVYESTRTNGIQLERIFLDCAQMLGAERADELGTIWAMTNLTPQEKITRLLNDLDANALYMLLLDNFEDLLDDTGTIVDEDVRAFIEMNLTAARGLHALVTTRIPLSLPVPLAPLDYHIELREGLPVDEGVTLLRELDAHGTYGLRDLADAELAHAVEALHGVPRALEVLVGIMANDPFAQLEDILPTFYEHQDTVRRIVQENYRRLDRSARQVMEALAVYDRPVPLVALEYLLEPFVPGLDIAGIARRLTQTSIVSIERKTRLMALHPIDRDYAYSQIPREGGGGGEYTRTALERRAADYFGQFKMAPGTWTTLDDLDPALWEFEHLIRAEDYDAAIRLLSSLNEGMLAKGMAPRTLAMHARIEGHLQDRRLLALQVFGTAITQSMLAMFEESLAGLETAIALAREIGDKHLEAHALSAKSAALRHMGRPAEAVQPALEAVALGRETNDRQLNAFNELPLIYAYLGKLRLAITHARELAQISEQHEDEGTAAHAYDTICACLTALLRYEEAKPVADRAEALLRAANDRDALGYVVNTQGLIALGLGEIETARRYLQEALAIARDNGYARPEAYFLFNIAHSYRLQSDYDAALRYANESLACFSGMQSRETPTAEALVSVIADAKNGDQSAQAAHLLELARASATNADLYGALAVANEAHALALSLGDTNLADAATTFIAQFQEQANAE